MLTQENVYQTEMLPSFAGTHMAKEEITDLLNRYLENYGHCFSNAAQKKYFSAFEKGLLSDLDRKTIEPIALAILGEKDVRGFQHFFKRSTISDESLSEQYRLLLSQAIGSEEGFLSVDGSDFPKKGTYSVGVARQHCGRLGKTENCQAGVFVSYASEKGYGLIEKELYLPKTWFSEDYASRYTSCKVPTDLVFKTKNELAAEMISKVIREGKFQVKWVGCDAAFGCDHNFLSSLPESVYYFAATRENELIFKERPMLELPQKKPSQAGRPFKHLRPSDTKLRLKHSLIYFKKSCVYGFFEILFQVFNWSLV